MAPTDSTVLISGDSGTGKEVVARYIHALSDRGGGPFISINCGALPENLLESELFGHIKGAFTGAVRDKQGLFVAARGGTFFLDEVGEMSPATQVKLLRALQEREVIPVGATEAIPIDARIIGATNRDLEEEIRRGGFRSDLYYRLNVIMLHLPPLSDRSDDVPVLTEHFLRRFAASRGREPQRLSEEALAALQAYDWPGNVRELENALERAAILSEGAEIGVAALPARITETEGPAARGRPDPREPLARDHRAGVHPLGAPGRSRKQDARRRGAGDRPLHPLPEAPPLRAAGMIRLRRTAREGASPRPTRIEIVPVGVLEREESLLAWLAEALGEALGLPIRARAGGWSCGTSGGARSGVRSTATASSTS